MQNDDANKGPKSLSNKFRLSASKINCIRACRQSNNFFQEPSAFGLSFFQAHGISKGRSNIVFSIYNLRRYSTWFVFIRWSIGRFLILAIEAASLVFQVHGKIIDLSSLTGLFNNSCVIFTRSEIYGKL